jgi:TolB-like protein/DNA-binding winged helix-turn-helix (wHTH) protein
MERQTAAFLRVGDWCVDPASGQISRDGETARLEARTLRLLLCLAERPGEVVSSEELLDQAWSGVSVTQDSVYQAVASLRRLLGDDPKQPVYIATVPRLGYRMVAAVSPWMAASAEPARPPSGPEAEAAAADGLVSIPAAESFFKGAGLAWVTGVVIGLLLVAGSLVLGRVGPGKASVAAPVAKSTKSIAVLPFLDLTEGMKQEEFADGMTEELIDKLSKIPGLRVAPPTSSFYFKGKQVPVAEIAQALGVAYLLDGSVRKSGPRLRVAARLIRADSGFVAWSESYDRPFDDLLMVQDDIAGDVTKALRVSIQGSSPLSAHP